MIEFGSNKAGSIRDHYLRTLESIYDKNEAKVLTNLVFEHVLGWKSHEVQTRKEELLNESDLVKFILILKRLKKFEPVQYVTEESWFRGLRFKVTKDVLIPRPETEELVQLAIERNKTNAFQNAVDLCCGSGCITLSLKNEIPFIDITGVDISEEALSLARENSHRLKLPAKFIQADILNDSFSPGKVDLIISNPPYVKESEKEQIHRNVLDHEPHLALFVRDEDPLVFYKKIGEIAEKSLNSEGFLCVEINTAFPEETANIFRTESFKEIRIHNDINSRPRMISAVKV